MSVARTVETLAMAGACAITSSAIGSVVDSLFPAGVPVDDVPLLTQLAAQFMLSTWTAAEIYHALLSMRGSDAPPPISDGIPMFFLYSSQPNMLARFNELNARLRARFLSSLFKPSSAASDNAVQQSEGGEPVAD